MSKTTSKRVSNKAVNETDEASQTSPSDERLLSLDALRGFDMFWIMGGGALIRAIADFTQSDGLLWLSSELHHPEWHGFAFYDLIFPLFLFIAGVSMPYSFEKRLSHGASKSSLARHAVVRGGLLVLLGLIGNGLLQFDFENLRYPSVLGRIGLAWMFAAFIFLGTGLRGRILWIVGLLAGYWAALKFIPVPEFGAGDLSPGHTLTDYIDRLLLPGKLYRGDRDPEGLLSTVPAIATALFGVITGQLLKSERWGGHVKTIIMVATGLLCLVAASYWNTSFPINKNLWTSSFVLHCAGWSLLFLSLFYLVIDVWKLKFWTFPLVVIGSNSIFIYMADDFIDFNHTARYFFEGAINLSGSWEPVLWPLSILVVEWLLLLVMYRKRIFLKV